MDTNTWLPSDDKDDKGCPTTTTQTVILRTTEIIKMSQPDPANLWSGFTDDVAGSNVRNLSKLAWDEEHSYCTVLAPIELDSKDSKDTKGDEELKNGKPCDAVLDKKMAENVMREFLGPWMTLEEATGEGSEGEGDGDGGGEG